VALSRQGEASNGGFVLVKDEFDAFLERGIVAHRFLRPHCAARSHDKLLAFSCQRFGLLSLMRPAPQGWRMGVLRKTQGKRRLPQIGVHAIVLAQPVGSGEHHPLSA
jgi:hypothetical protein